MGSYKLGSECCNNCIHWDAERDDKHGKENVYSHKNCAKCTSSHGPRKGLNTLSSDTCPYFSHIWGITKTFSTQASETSSPSNPLTGMIAGIDEPSRAYMEAILDSTMRSASINQAAKVVPTPEPAKEEEDDLNGEAEEKFADAMKELGRANERASELVAEGLDTKYMFNEKSVDFMHMLDRAREGAAKDQFAFARAFWEGTHGVLSVEHLNAQGKSNIPLEWCRKAAEQGLAEAQYEMGCRSFSDASGFEWFNKAAAQGHAASMEKLSEVRTKLIGRATEYLTQCLELVDDVDKTIECIKLATNELEKEWSDPVPLYKLDGDFVHKFIERLEQKAEQGSPELQNVIGKMYAAYSSCRYIIEGDDTKAVLWFERAAKGGCLDAMDNLGVCYADGTGVARSEEKAVQWYQKAAEAGLDWGQYHFAIKLLNGEGIGKNVELARSWLQKAADQGLKKAQERIDSLDDECSADNDPESAMRAGWKLYKNSNYEKAFQFFHLAEEAGIGEARYALGLCYDSGNGVSKDEEKGVELFKAAATKWFVSTSSDYKDQDGEFNNYGSSCRKVAEYWEGRNESEKAAKWFRFAARSGSYSAAKSLGYNYMKGTNGFEVDLQKAVYWLQIGVWLNLPAADSNWGADAYLEDYLKDATEKLGVACDDLNEMEDKDVFAKACKGDPDSQYQIGCWMFNGEQSFGVDVCAAMAWWYRAALQGHVRAQLKIANKFRTGCDDVEKDRKTALVWFIKAAEKGSAAGQFWTGRFYAEGWGGVEKDPIKAREWYMKSAEQDNVDAICALGWIYQLGDGVGVDFSLAAKWFKKGSELDDGVCMNNLARLYEEGKGVEQDYRIAFDLFNKATGCGCSRACYHIGRFFENGLGIDADLEKAKEWYEKAAEKGDKDAKGALERLG